MREEYKKKWYISTYQIKVKEIKNIYFIYDKINTEEEFVEYQKKYNKRFIISCSKTRT